MLPSLLLTLMLSAQTAPPPSQPWPRIRLDAYLPALDDTSRSFEEARTFVLTNGEASLPWTPPQVEMSAAEDLSRTSLSVAFNWVWLTDSQGRRPIWFARLRAMDGERTIERFADSRQCPGVEESLRQLDALPALEPRTPGLPEPGEAPDLTDVGGGYLHDNGYRIRLRGLFAGARYSQRLDMTGGSDAPFAPVIADSLTRLKSCWTETPPPRR
ncbi:hypothetical protein [Brevundimonas sp.]|uniref:hypothetical protein n=1 Tax=Brevundimonas sp. TaxID=1871086 RepID=UPI002FC859A1